MEQTSPRGKRVYMRFMKNGRTLRKDLRIMGRGLKEFDRILPGQLIYVALRSVVAAVCPYVAVVAMACILGELTGRQRGYRLLVYVAVAVLTVFLLTVIRSVLEARIAVGYSDLFAAHEIFLTDKAYDLPYELLESEEVRHLRDQVSGSISVSGAGMASLYWDTEAVCNSLCAGIFALVLCVRYGMRMAPGVTFCLLVLAGLCAGISGRMTSRRWDVAYKVFEQGAAYQRYGDYYTMNYLPDENMGMDIRIFSQKQLVLEESRKRCYEPFAIGKRREMRADCLYGSIKLLCMGMCGLAVYGLVAAQALQGRVPVGDVLVLYTAVTSLILSLSNVTETFTDLRNNNVHLEHYFTYMDLPEESAGDPPSDRNRSEHSRQGRDGEPDFRRHPPKNRISEICFDHVSFRYPGSEEYALEDVSLTIHGGEKLAVVGENGSGKTTLVKLLCRLYRPSRGQILLNGRDIWLYSREEYTGLLSTVFQDFSLFAFPVGANVAACRDFDRRRAQTALEQAGLWNKVASLPRGLDQAITADYEEDGVRLSGGEAQKAAIARALYKDGAMLILDEPTAALDPYAEATIYEQLFRSLEQSGNTGWTLLSVSHRMSTCRYCDRVAVFSQGRLVQLGAHRQLVQETGSVYQRLWQAQASYYQENSEDKNPA